MTSEAATVRRLQVPSWAEELRGCLKIPKGKGPYLGCLGEFWVFRVQGLELRVKGFIMGSGFWAGKRF